MSDLFSTKSGLHFAKKQYKEVPTYTKWAAHDFFFTGLPNLSGSGLGIRVCVIGSGLPEHRLLRSIDGGGDLSPSDNLEDFTGHATAVAGIIGANDPGALVGLAPHCILEFAKVTNDKGQADPHSIVAGLLYAMTNNCNIAVVTNTPTIQHDLIDKAVNKLVDCGTCVLMDGTIENAVIPSNAVASPIIDINKTRVTTAKQHTYCEIDTVDFSIAIAAGITALIMEQRGALRKPPRQTLDQQMRAIFKH